MVCSLLLQSAVDLLQDGYRMPFPRPHSPGKARGPAVNAQNMNGLRPSLADKKRGGGQIFQILYILVQDFYLNLMRKLHVRNIVFFFS